MKPQATINTIDDWANKWRIKINESKSTHIAFILRNQTCQTVQMVSVDLPRKNEVKCLCMHLDGRLTLPKHMKTKRKELNLKGETSGLATRNKINTINRKQTPPIQNSTQTHMDLWNSATGDNLQFQLRNPPAFSIQDSPIHSEFTSVHKQPQDL
jgi:hypothetical protein